MRTVASCAVAAALALSIATAPAAGAARFRGIVSAIGPAVQARMTGRSWHAGCPVSLSQLRLLTLSYWGFDNRPHTGKLVVNADVASTVVSVFHRLYDTRFPIRRMQLVDDYGGNDFRSIEADNTSAFNCRVATGSTHWSNHAYGLAIDVNPIENPYVSNGHTAHRRSRRYLDRSRHRRGMAYRGGALVRAFTRAGWGWGGSWSNPKDYQHFSATGR
jgi:D-alanyl-D-alanine carboxypeptidase